MRSLGDFITFLRRMVFLYALFMVCRVLFYLFNAQLIGPITWGEVPLLLKGSLIFDSGSIFYLNIPFLFFSLIPFRFRRYVWYQTGLMWLFVVVNSLGLMVDTADVFYFPFKLARIASDDIHFLTNGNFGTLMVSFMKDYWYGALLFAGLVFLLWRGFRAIRYRETIIRSSVVYFLSQTLLLAFSAVAAIVLIRGGNISAATYPITVSDASLYASPQKVPLVLSNPFALIRTKNQGVTVPVYYTEEELGTLFSPIRQPADSSHRRVEGRPNVMIILLESFGAAHIKELSDQFPAGLPSYTPFLDSLIREGYAFRNAYHNGLRSIDALPAVWSSIPSFKTQFLSLPQSTAPHNSLPFAFREMGYSTAFMHGAVRESMSFVAFGKSVGVESFFSQEEYEAENGKGDFDGKWGIWDHKFFPFAAKKLNTLKHPFFATMFSLSSHHPYILPSGFEGRYPEGTHPLHHMLGYSDDALRNFFGELSKNDWYDNTIFIITADHSSGADNEKYLKVPYNFAVPLVMYSPSGLFRGDDTRPAGHIDVMPTLLGLFHYPKPYFAYGNDLFAGDKPGFTINYMGAFNTISDSLVYIFNEKDFLEIYNYRTDPYHRENLAGKIPADSAQRWTKAFIQQYYTHIKNRSFTAP